MDDHNLRYQYLAKFDKAIIEMAKEQNLLESTSSTLLHEHNSDMVLGFRRAGIIFLFNFHPDQSYTDYEINTPQGEYGLLLDSDSKNYGGHGRLKQSQNFFSVTKKKGPNRQNNIHVYLPTRTAIILIKKK